MNIKTNILIRIYLIFGLICLLGLAVLGKVYTIQTYKGNYWAAKADSLHTKFFDIEAERGNIYSSDERLLATSLPYFDLYVDFGSKAMSDELFEANVDSLAICMYNYFGEKSVSAYTREFTTARKKRKHYYQLRKNVNYDELKTIEKWPLFRAGKYKGGLIVERRDRRKNPYGLLAQRTIGYSREKNDVGLEASYNKYLSGNMGKILKQKIAGGTWVPIDKERAIEPENGRDIYTTLDINLQDLAEKELANAITASQADFGCAVVMEVKTGAIKAIANLGWDKNGQLVEKANYAIGFRSEPGSTFKLVSYLAMLDDGAITLDDSVNITGGVANFFGATMRDDHPHQNIVTPVIAFAQSSNVAVARFAMKAFSGKKARFYQKMDQFGVTQKSGIDLVGEVSPVISKPEKWSGLSLPWKATGYENLITPLQLLTFYNAVANNGYRVEPYLVEKIVENGKIIKKHTPVVSAKPIASEKALADAGVLLRAVIESPEGTGRGIQSAFFKFAGKTGTAKIKGEDRGYGNANQAMFCGFFPADNPQYSCIVMIHSPKGIYRTGGGLAAPVFKTIAEKVLSTDLNTAMQINAGKKPQGPPQVAVKGEVGQLKSIAEKWKTDFNLNDNIAFAGIEIHSKSIKLMPLAVQEKKVPDVVGMAFDDALYLLENSGLKIIYSGRGKVFEQSISAGTPVKKGDIIKIQLK